MRAILGKGHVARRLVLHRAWNPASQCQYPRAVGANCGGTYRPTLPVRPYSLQPHQSAIGRHTVSRQVKEVTQDEAVVLQRLLGVLEGTPSAHQSAELLRREIERLRDELFCIVVISEYNVGKSSLINALLGERYLREGPTPTTAEVTVVRYGDSRRVWTIAPGLASLSVPIPWLKDLSIVDTPGTNAIDRTHESLTRDYIPRSDLILFLTSAERPLSESERLLLEGISAWGKKTVLVVNKIDLIDDPAAFQTVMAYVQDHSRAVLGTSPKVFAVSARMAMQGKINSNANQLRSSNFEQLESYIQDTLDSGESLRLKLESPLSVGAVLTKRHSATLQKRLDMLTADLHCLRTTVTTLKTFEEVMRDGFAIRLDRVTRAVQALGERADRFFDHRLQLKQAMGFLFARDKNFEVEFMDDVVGDLPREIDRHTEEFGRWLVDKTLHNWRSTAEIFEQRAMARQTALAAENLGQEAVLDKMRDGQFLMDFDGQRQQLLSDLREASSGFVYGYDKKAEGLQISDSVHMALMAGVGLNIAGIGLVGFLAKAAMIGVGGVLSGGALAALGLSILPYRRTQLKAELAHGVATLQSRLREQMVDAFETFMRQHTDNIHKAVAPFETFVHMQMADNQRQLDTLREIEDSIARLHERVAALRLSSK